MCRLSSVVCTFHIPLTICPLGLRRSTACHLCRSLARGEEEDRRLCCLCLCLCMLSGQSSFPRISCLSLWSSRYPLPRAPPPARSYSIIYLPPLDPIYTSSRPFMRILPRLNPYLPHRQSVPPPPPPARPRQSSVLSPPALPVIRYSTIHTCPPCPLERAIPSSTRESSPIHPHPNAESQIAGAGPTLRIQIARPSQPIRNAPPTPPHPTPSHNTSTSIHRPTSSSIRTPHPAPHRAQHSMPVVFCIL